MNFIKKPEKKLIPLGSLSLITTSLCNLQCKYCYICKENMSLLKEMDKVIEKEWEENIYIKRIKDELNDDISTISRISLWGGETLLHLDRFTNNFKSFVDLLPNFNSIDWSTNLTIPITVEILNRLFLAIKTYAPNRLFTITFQISVDGPMEINDLTRGNGSTEKLLKVYNQLLDITLPDNIILKLSTKATLSMDSIPFLTSLDNVKKYYNWFQNELYYPFLRSRLKNTSKAEMILGNPNFIDPYKFSQQDGFIIAEAYRVIQSYSKIHNLSGFEGVSLVPLMGRFENPGCAFLNQSINTYKSGYGCGQLTGSICMGPNGKYAVCHRGVFDIYLNKYKAPNDPQFNKDWIFSPEEYYKRRIAANTTYLYSTKMITEEYKVFIKALARAGQIDKKYLENEGALTRYINFIMRYKSLCYHVNLEYYGSMFVQDQSLAKALLNGAFDVLEEEILFVENFRRGKR